MILPSPASNTGRKETVEAKSVFKISCKILHSSQDHNHRAIHSLVLPLLLGSIDV